LKSASQTTIFGIRLKVDPKILVGGIVLMAAVLFWYNSRGDEDSTPANVTRPVAPVTVGMPKSHIATTRRGSTSTNDRGTLRLRPVDATRGDVDPTLRLDLLTRLQSEDEVPAGRSLFEAGPTPAEVQAAHLAAIKGPMIPPKDVPPPPAPAPTGLAPLNIPLKFYGFVQPSDKREVSRGFFMDGENVLVATEGQVLKQKYRVLELTAKTARLQDIQLKQDETLQVVPEAAAQ
jgi:hypothetical protein